MLLVGGMGTRLRSVIFSTPKPLAPIGTSAFLELLVRQLRSQGIRRLVMCSGYLANQIETLFGDGSSHDVQIEYSVEQYPLGTAGAVKMARPFLEDCPELIVMNGDSFIQVDLHRLLNFHRQNRAMVSMVVRKVEDSARYGTVRLDKSGRVTGFLEKTGDSVEGIVNAGVYVFQHEVIENIADGPASLERDVFPGLLDRGIFALEEKGVFIDIGTPEDYQLAQRLLHQLESAAVTQREGTQES